MYRQTLLFIFLTAMVISCGGGNGSPDPEITGIQPTSGPPGTMVTISGQGFAPEASGNEVSFSGTEAQITSASESQLQATVPDGSSSGAVSVMVGEKSTSGPNFTVEAAAPGISSVEPDSGIVGAKVTITGMNFSATASENSISFNGTSATVKSATETELVTDVPQGATDGPIEVTVEQKSTTGPAFDVITTGAVDFLFSTSGSEKDPNGYTLNFNGGQTSISPTTSKNTKGALEEGDYQAELTDIASNCSLRDQNPRTITIVAGDTTSTSFEIECRAVAKNKIVFTSDRSGNDDIYIMDPDGSNLQRLTTNLAEDRRPVLSNDGTRIAFYSTRDNPGGDIYLMEIDGNNIFRLTNGNPSNAKSWSPDDSQLVFEGSRTGESAIYIINRDGSSEERLTNLQSSSGSPSWSPDGTSIVFVNSTSGNNDIYKMSANGSNIEQITNNSARDADPRWSPDGSEIAFTSSRDGGDRDVFIMDADGSNLRNITNNSGIRDQNPSWSPDGSRLLFETFRNSNLEIFVIDDSGMETNISNSSASDSYPFWSPVK